MCSNLQNHMLLRCFERQARLIPAFQEYKIHLCVIVTIIMWERSASSSFSYSFWNFCFHIKSWCIAMWKPVIYEAIGRNLSKEQLFSMNLHFTATEGLPRWAEGWHRHAPEQGAAPAASVWVSQQGLPALPLSYHQDLLLCSRRVSHPAGRCPASHLFRLLRVHGGPERQHCAGYSG